MTNPARRPAQDGVRSVVRDIIVEDLPPHPPEQVWKALTAELIGRWLPDDVELAVGKSFSFATRPVGTWDGIVQCEVLEIVSFRRLVHSWEGGADVGNGEDSYGSRLDSVVTWTLQPEGRGTRLRMVHSGFRSPGNDFAYGAMSAGWQRIVGMISEIAAAQ